MRPFVEASFALTLTAVLALALPAGAQGPGHASRPSLTEPDSRPAPTFDARLASAFGVRGGLTSDEVARRAEATSPDVRDKALGVQAADGERQRAMWQFLPKLEGTARYTRLSPITQAPLGQLTDGTLVVSANPDEGEIQPNDPIFRQKPTLPTLPVILNNYSLDANLTIPLSDYALRMFHALGVAEKSKRAAELEEKAARAKTTAEARIAYYQWARARGQVVVAEQGYEQAKSHFADAQHGQSVGVVSRADVLRAESQVKRSELLVTQAKNLAHLAEERIRTMMHEPPGSAHEVGEALFAPTAAGPQVEAVDRLQAEAFRRRLELRALSEAAASMRQGADLQRVAFLPRLDATAGATFANPNTRYVPQQRVWAATWQAGLVLTWTPSDIPQAAAAASTSEARASQLDAKRASLEDAVRLEVLEALAAVEEAAAALESTQRALASSEESYRVRRDLYRSGRATFIELTDAETDVTRSRFDAVNAHIDARISRVRLAHAVGRDVSSDADATAADDAPGAP
jgi:outer membrane protein TolC